MLGETEFADLSRPRTAKTKAEKLSRILPILACPACGSPLDTETAGPLACPVCAASFGRTETAFDFLNDAIRREYRISATENVSDHPYGPPSLEPIHRHRDGLVLDCGAGSKSMDYANVVNVEIVPYPSTDVLTVGQALPFQDESFDAVLSLSVLEHVSDPCRCAAEIARVLKPGGELICVVPFLQPLHGYPNHFFNMTSEGLCM
jgi:SAM-dependent methyltransferase|tara:strand:+ start:2294 stop:2908 length:615 start_codon:yes stop_codon:yes gene_type:complete